MSKSQRKPSSAKPKTSTGRKEVLKTKFHFFPSTTNDGREATGLFAGGGFAPFRVKTPKQAEQIITHYKPQTAFYQVSKSWYVTVEGTRKKYRGYSPMSSPQAKSETTINRLLRQSQTSAIRKATGNHLDYEGKQPDRLAPGEKGFLLLIWFTKQNKNTFTALRK
jgi:hypothetical protein